MYDILVFHLPGTQLLKIALIFINMITDSSLKPCKELYLKRKKVKG